MRDGLDSSLLTGLVKGPCRVLDLRESIKDLHEIAKGAVWASVITHLAGWDVAFGAGSILAACDEQLFRVVANIHGEDGMPPLYNTVTASDLDSMDTSCDERLEDCREAGMKEV